MTIEVSEAKQADGFGASAFHGALPLMIWAAHFFVSYGSAEVACALHLYRFTVLDVSAPRIWLWVISVATIATLLIMTIRAVWHSGANTESGTAGIVQIGASVLALVGVLWSAVPIVLLDGPTICSAAR